MEEQIRLRDRIKKDEEIKLIKKRGTIDDEPQDELAVTSQWNNPADSENTKEEDIKYEKPLESSKPNSKEFSEPMVSRTRPNSNPKSQNTDNRGKRGNLLLLF